MSDVRRGMSWSIGIGMGCLAVVVLLLGSCLACGVLVPNFMDAYEKGKETRLDQTDQVEEEDSTDSPESQQD